jgi:hypothetical protein
MWPNIVADTAIHGAIWWALLTLAATVLTGSRRSLRRARGHCPLCAYDLRHEFGRGCSECGWNRASPSSAGEASAKAIPE